MADPEGYSSNSFFSLRNIIIFIVLALIAYAAIYTLFLKKDTANTSPMMTTEESNDTMSMTVALATQNESNQSGTATLTEKDGKTTVSISLDNPVDDSPQPAHIHSGACPTPGDVVYPLTDLTGGKSETVIDATIASLRSKLPLAINVHKSESESDMYVACGDLK